MTPHFQRLTICDARRETADAVSLAFAVPPELRATYRFTQGQHLTLRANIDGQEVRRSYSVCSGVHEYLQHGELRVAVKLVEGGLFSRFVTDQLQRGDALDVMAPDGRFFTPLDPTHAKHYVAFAAGSGITPVLSIIKSTLAHEPASRFTLIYGNRRADTVLFREQLEDLKNLYLSRLALHYVFSRAASDVPLTHGRIDAKKCAAFLKLIPAATIDEAFICGPANMIDVAHAALLAGGMAPQHVHTERFGVPLQALPPQPIAETSLDQAGQVALTVVLDGKQHALKLPRLGTSILDVALAAGLDLPYACKGGVCCTCRAKILEGSVTMDKNYTLEPSEIAQGFVLTCQSHPTSDRVVVSFDER